MPRMLFQKTGNAIWISHLDLMRLFQRAFKRAGLPLTHTHGFNPRPSVSIALPLSVGVESQCELLDFDLDCDFDHLESIADRLNAVLVDGVKVLRVYDNCSKIRDLALMHSLVTLEYDNGIPDGAADAISCLFSQDSLIVTKKSKNGPQEQDIIPLIRDIKISEAEGERLMMNVLHCCQNPTLNPMQIPAAICKYLPEYIPDFSKCSRIEIYNNKEEVFR